MPLPDIGILDNVSQAINPTVTRYTISNSYGRRGARMSIQLDLEHGLWHYVALSCSSTDSCFYCHLNPFEIYNDQIISSRIILESQLSHFLNRTFPFCPGRSDSPPAAMALGLHRPVLGILGWWMKAPLTMEIWKLGNWGWGPVCLYLYLSVQSLHTVTFWRSKRLSEDLGSTEFKLLEEERKRRRT